METTTIRVDRATRDRLREIAAADGRPIIEVARDAVAGLERTRRIERVKGDLARLRADPEAWADYQREGEGLHVRDDLD